MSNKKLLTLVAATVLALSAVPAMADDHVSFGLSINGGGYERGHGHHRDFREVRREYFRNEYREHFYGGHGYRHAYYGYNPYFYQSPRVVYVQPQPVIEQRIILEDAQPVRANAGRIVSNDPYCREYQRNVVVGGARQESYGTACRQPDGAWKIVSE